MAKRPKKQPTDGGQQTPAPNGDEPKKKPKRDRKKPDAMRKAPTGSQDAKGRFVPGNKANPAGRPKGSRNKTTLLVEALLEDEAEELTRALISKAKRGSTHALELIFARLAPVRRDRPIEIALPRIETLADMVAAHGGVIQAVADGEISPAEGRELAGLLDLRRRAVESVELEARLAALEQRLEQQGAAQ